jgi:hypothetical protein
LALYVIVGYFTSRKLLCNDPESKQVNPSDDMMQRGLCLVPEPALPLDHALAPPTQSRFSSD